MKNLLKIITISSIILNIVLIYLFVIKGSTFESKDTRTGIKMSESNKEFVLDEMRTFLASIEQINEGLLENNPQTIIDAGLISGGSVIENAPNGLLKTFPIGFKTLGFSTHQLFDDIVSSTKQEFNKTKIQKKMDLLLKNCVSCHKTYKIAID